jgi:hypothetical protein
MADWVTISSLATAGGTLVLAVATFSSVRSANRSTRLAERALLVGQRPILIPSHDDDPEQSVRFGDGELINLRGHSGTVELRRDNLYMAISVRNGGNGLALIQAWRIEVADQTGNRPPPTDEFRRQQRDIYIPPGETGYWQGAIRNRSDPAYDPIREAMRSRSRISIDLMYGDYEGGQRTIARIGLTKDGAAVREGAEPDDYRAEVGRYWNIDGIDPRDRPEAPPDLSP